MRTNRTYQEAVQRGRLLQILQKSFTFHKGMQNVCKFPANGPDDIEL